MHSRGVIIEVLLQNARCNNKDSMYYVTVLKGMKIVCVCTCLCVCFCVWSYHNT